MDRLNHLRGEAGGSRDSTLDTTSPPSESFMTANESSSKYFSLSEVDSVDSTFDISSIKDVSLASTATDTEGTITNADELISNLSPIGKKSDMLDSYKIGKQIEAANILSGGVDIFDDNDNSYDGDELVIDDNVDVDDKSNSELKQPEEMPFKSDENMIESTLINEEMDIASKDTEVVLQIDGKNVDAIDIGNGLYLYRKEGQEELAAVQIIDDDQQQTSFKFLKVRENVEGNLEVYEEIEIEVPKEVPAKEGKMPEKKTSSHVPITDINKVISESGCNKVAEKKSKVPRKEPILTRTEVIEVDGNKESPSDSKTEVNINGKMMKFSESRKSPVIGSYTAMTYHSTPNKERIPLTKTMVDQQLHPNRHSDNVKKTIEVHTDSSKQRTAETPTKNKDAGDDTKNVDVSDDTKNVDVSDDNKHVVVNDDSKTIDADVDNKNIEEAKSEKELVIDETIESVDIPKDTDKESTDEKNIDKDKAEDLVPSTNEVMNEKCDDIIELPVEQENVVDSTNKDVASGKVIVEENVDEVIVCDDDKEEKSSEKNVNVIESTEEDVLIVEVSESPSSKVEEKIDEPVKTDSVEIVKVDNVMATKQVEVKQSEPVQISIDENVKKIDVVNEKNKETVVDNTQCDNQDKTKNEEIIYDITDQDNDDIIIIDDSEIDDSKIVDKSSSDLKVEDRKQSNVESDISKENEAIPKVNECPGDKDKKDITTTESTTPADVLEKQEEITKKDETSLSSENMKTCQSKIPVPISKPESVTTEPIKSETLLAKDLVVPIDANKEKVESKLETLKETGPVEKEVKEVVKHIPVAEVPTQPYSKLEKSPKVETKLDKNQDKLIYVPEALTSKTTALISSMTSKAEVMPRRENNVLEKSPKKLSKPVPFVESQSKITPLKTDSTSNIKADSSVKPVEKSSKLPSREVKEQKQVVKGTSQHFSEVTPQTSSKDADIKITSKEPLPGTRNIVKEVAGSSVPKEEQPSCSGIQDVSSTSADSLPSQSSDNRNEAGEARDDSNTDEAGSKEAVPFGKWTATNRKEFLIKIKTRTTVTPAVPSTSSNQLKNTNDLNRRDVLQKIDSQRQQSSSAAALAKNQEANKTVKNEAAFVSKTNLIPKKDNVQETKVLPKPVVVKETSEIVVEKAPVKQDVPNNLQNEGAQVATVTSVKKEGAQRTEVNYQDLINKTIEDMIQRTPTKPQDEPSQASAKDSTISQSGKFSQNYKPTDQATLDEIEMKMNELHGIPFIERPPHELPVVPVAEPKPKTYSKIDKEKTNIHNKTSKIPNLLPYSNKNPTKTIKESVIEVDSEDEVIEHEPITGDITITKKNVTAKLPPKEKAKSYAIIDKPKQDAGKKESIITEKDFDKFARRNSKTYENCLTLNLDSKDPRNVIQTLVEKDPYPKNYSKNDMSRMDPKAKVPYKYQNVHPNVQPAKVHGPKVGTTTSEDASNRNQSKLQKAYQSALSAKRQLECPITIIEDKPVKVVFMDNMEFVQSPLNLQGPQLSPVKKIVTESDNFTVSTLDSLESETADTTEDSKAQEEIKTKSKHQRKQVLTPVEEPELELIEPKDLGLEVSPKKKRKTEEEKTDKTVKYPMRKKYYLLGSNTVADEKYTHTADVIKNPLKETVNLNDNGVSHKNAVSAIDSLVKAAELLEHQSENRNIIDSPNTDSQQSTPVKRGRGRPRKYPLPEGGVEKNKVPSPQKKPRLIDAKVPKRDPVTTTDDDEDDSDDEIIKENWTMGKINENIVCPICNKLFRTENVVFKHVKHCTGPSPSRSGSDKRSPRRMRPSQESDSKSQGSKSDDMDLDDDKPLVVRKETPKKRKSKDSIAKSDDKDEVIVIEDTPPVKEKTERKEKETDDRKIHESRKPRAKLFNKGNDLVCEFCGKTFRQLSYLVSHKLQHKKEESKKVEKEAPAAIKSVYSCEVCKKEFRKLHHLVQHRIIHNPSSVPTRTQRKSSSEQSDTKIEKEPNSSKHTEDASAGFRCEPCDKSFRKLHHLVEHRETHDGINRQKTTPAVVQNNVEKPVNLHQCEVCKKTFRKLHHLIEHKEQHVETSSEKSDDKSVKSSLSTKDIIHECSLCYMVFPNEHSLNKHTIICQRKKRQSKQAKPVEGSEAGESVEDSSESAKVEEKSENIDTPKVKEEDIKEDAHKNEAVEKMELPVEKPKSVEEKPAEVIKEVQREIETVPQKIETKPVEPQVTAPAKREFSETEIVKTEVKPEVPEKIKKVEVTETKVQETPKKKTPKEKSTPNVNKRPKTTAPAQVSSAEDNKPAVESSDDDEVRYMLNPNFKVEDVTEEKVFMKVRANKRSSLQIERPNSKDLVKRRTSLQHPPKIPRLKPKPVEPASVKIVAKTPKVEPLPSTDSDDSETVKYSFPKTIPEKPTKSAQDRTPQKKTLADKRKSLSGIAKRKSLGKVVTARHKPLPPVKQIKRRTLEVEHRCDCGQLFSSAALLSRHTTLAHTPPRIRRRRSPLPEVKPDIKPAPRKSSGADKPKQAPASRKSSTRSDSSTSTNAKLNKQETKPTRKSLDKDTKTPAEAKKPKPEKSEAKSSVKPRRTGAHRGVPVPEKMRKLMQKNNK